MHPRAVVPRPLHDLAVRQGGYLSLAQALDHGLSPAAVRGLVGRRSVLRATSGVLDLVVARPDAADWAARRRRPAWLALLAYGPRAVAVGACALALHGVVGLPASVRPECALPGARNRRDRDGVAVRQFEDGARVVEVAGARSVSLHRALAQAVPELPRRHALAVLDGLLAAGRTTRQQLDEVHDLARGRRGIASRHDLWELADARAESPLESFARLECIEGGVAPDALQLVLHHPADGRPFARGDMAWLRRDGRWLVAEIDGTEVHGTAQAVHADRLRQNLLVGSGRVDLLRFTARDLGRIAATVRTTLGLR